MAVVRFDPRVGPIARRRRRRHRRPTVTVIIPTYTWASVLRYSAASVLAQTVADIELLVIGDGCTDESERVVRSLDDERVSWFNLRRNFASQVGPNNVGLSIARADLIAYCGHDDLWLPDHLERLLETGAGFAHATQLRVDPGLTPYLVPTEPWAYTPGAWLPPTSMLHPRTAAVRVGGWRLPQRGQWEDPEANLLKRLSEVLGPPTYVRRVTSVKLPAALRRGVYRERPCDEQAAWMARIQAAPDTETFVCESLGNRDLVPPARYRPEDVPPELLGMAGVDAVQRRQMARVVKGLDAGGVPQRSATDGDSTSGTR
ncbi:MAG: glycosyltransferase family 2 protein [Ilumatobacteraceae bacterium]